MMQMALTIPLLAPASIQPPYPELIEVLLLVALLCFGGTLICLVVAYGALRLVLGGTAGAQGVLAEIAHVARTYLWLSGGAAVTIGAIEFVCGWGELCRNPGPLFTLILSLLILLAPPLGASVGRVLLFPERIASRKAFFLVSVTLILSAAGLIVLAIVTW